MKRSFKVRVICLIIAAVVLSVAVAAAAIMGSPYETLKNAMLDAMAYRNATIDGVITLSVNGEVVSTEKMYNVVGEDGSLNYNFDNKGNQKSFTYSKKDLRISPALWGDDQEDEWYSAHLYPNVGYYSSYTGNGFLSLSQEERNSSSVRFFELLVDILVGDLKNNITMSSENGVRRVQGTLTESQVPEIVRAGIDMMVEQSGDYYNHREVSFDGVEYVTEQIRIHNDVKTVTIWSQPVRAMTSEEREAWEEGWIYEMYGDKANDVNLYGVTFINDDPYVCTGQQQLVREYTAPISRSDFDNRNYEDPFNIPMQKFVLNYVRGEATIDEDGNLLSLDADATITVTDILGDTNVIDIKGRILFSDIGTSIPVCPIPGAEQLLTPEYIKATFGNDYYMDFYFTLDENGAINADSITTTHPYEIEKQRGAAYYTPAPIPKGIVSLNGTETIQIEYAIDENTNTTTTEIDAGIDTDIDAGIDAKNDTGNDINFDTEINTGIDSGIDINFDTEIDAGIDTDIDAGIKLE